jgi:hypothetical protein
MHTNIHKLKDSTFLKPGFAQGSGRFFTGCKGVKRDRAGL